MMELWLSWPRWVRAGIAVAILVYPAYALWHGVFWPWGWAVGGSLLLLSLPRTIRPRY